MASLYSAGVRVFAQSNLTNATDHRQRRAQLVRRVGGESAKLLERRFEPCERIVDDRRKPPDFVVLIQAPIDVRGDVRR